MLSRGLQPGRARFPPGLAQHRHGSGPGPSACPALTAGLPQLYHACHGPGLSVLCFVRHDLLDYFSVYGTALSMWVSLMGEWSPAQPGPAPPAPP